MIFHDSTLTDMVIQRPRTLKDFAQLSGVGATKLENYGQSFLDVLDEHALQYGWNSRTPSPTTFAVENTPFSETVEETLDAFKQGLPPEQIAVLRQLKPSTIYNHLAQAIEMGQVPLRQVINLKEEEIHEIEDKLLERPIEEQDSLKPVFEVFGGEYSYEILRCVRAHLWQRK